MRAPLLYIALLATQIAWHQAGAATEDPALRLIAVTDAGEFSTLHVSGESISVKSATGLVSIDDGTRWRLEGDLLGGFEHVEFSPYFRITRGVSPDRPVDRAQYYGVVHVWRDGRWSDNQLDGAIVVALWLVDGRVASVRAAAASPNAGPSAALAALFAFELDESMRGGAPVVLVVKGNRFEKPKPLFDDISHNRIVATMHLAPGGATTTQVGRNELNARTRRGRIALIHLAAESGSVEWMQKLLDAEASTQAAQSPLLIAARLGRRPMVEMLLAPERRKRFSASERTEARAAALAHGHSETAALLLDPKTRRGWEEVFEGALAVDDQATLEALLPLAEDATWRNLRPETVHAIIDCGRVAWLQRAVAAGYNFKRRCDVQQMDAWDHARRTSSPEILAAMPSRATLPARDREGAMTPPASRPDVPIREGIGMSHPPRLEQPLRVPISRTLNWTVATPGRPSTEGYVTPPAMPAGPITTGTMQYSTDSPTGIWCVAAVLVEADGRPSRVEIVASAPGYERPVTEALMQARFRPGLSNGTPSPSRVTMPILLRP